MASEIATPAQSLSDMIGGQSRLVSSMDLTKLDNRKILMAALQSTDGKLTDMVNTTIEAVNYVAHDVKVNGKAEGEYIDCIRLVIVDKAGKTYGCVSNTLLRSLATICYVFGTPPWATPIKLTVRTKRNGEKAIYWFEAK
jgi:hypothetical protein